MTVFLIIVTVVLLSATLYISTLLTSSTPPTQIQKTKAAAITYTRKIDLFSTTPTPTDIPTITPLAGRSPTAAPVGTDNAPQTTVIPTKKPTLLAQAASPTPSPVPKLPNTAAAGGVTPQVTIAPTKAVLPSMQPTTLSPTIIPTNIPTNIPTPSPVTPSPTPTMQPLLAYKSTSISPTPTVSNSGTSQPSPTTTLSPTKKVLPTGTQQLPETGWIQISSILFIVATSTILFSLLF